MRKLLFLGLALATLMSCQQKQRYFSESPEIDSFKASISQYNNGEWETWRTQFADTAKLYVNSAKSITAADLENAQKELLSNFSSYGFQDKGSFAEMVIDSDEEAWVNYWANWHGKLKANDKEINVPVHITAQYVDGKVVEIYDYYDSGIVSNALAEIEKANNMPVEEKTIMAGIDNFIEEFFNKQGADSEIVNTLLADDYVRYLNDVKVASSSKEFIEGMNAFFTGFPDFHIKLLHRSPVIGNEEFVHWELTGTNTGEFNGSPATGKKVKVTGLSRVHFNGNGKIDEENVFYNELDLMKQLGHSLN